MKDSKPRVVFKNYNPKQIMLLPPSLEELVEANHPVRIVNSVIDRLTLYPLVEQYKGGGTSSYHPRMLLKVLVYSYLCNIYSSRKMEENTKQNIHFMWLSGMQKPDHNTINRFRSERLKNVFKQLFAQVVELLAEAGHISLKEIYTDGTKIEANANRYTFVWGNSIKYQKSKMQEQLKELWSYAEGIAEEEMKDTEPIIFNEISPEAITQAVEKINEVLQNKKASKKVKQKLHYIKKKWINRLKQYNKQEEVLCKRNSYSKTDTDATFMRMKEDHMKNGQLKPAYNVQLSTNKQYIVHYSVHQNPTDTTTLGSHLEELIRLHPNNKPEELIADAGYGSEQNYALLEKHNIIAYVKYNYFDKEQGKKLKNDPFRADNLHYNKENDCFYCPMGQAMHKIGIGKRMTANGYEQQITCYQAQNCNGCPLRNGCHQAKHNRIIEINHTLRQYKQQARELLQTEKGIKHRKKRCYDTEPVFANIKHNKNFRKYQLRGLEKVEIETGLMALAHNFQKLTA